MEHLPDSQLVDLADGLARAAAGRAGADSSVPHLIGVVGSVAVGKSTFASHLAQGIRDGGLRVEVVSTDAFLLDNVTLEPLGGAFKKGYPVSYDWEELRRFFDDADDGGEAMSTPVYSHERFDVVRDERHRFDTPDVVVMEGLNLLQVAPDGAWTPADRLDRSIYLDAPRDVVEQWFVDRFTRLTAAEVDDPSGFYHQFRDMPPEQVDATARWVWSEINLPNLVEHIEPSRDRADLVVHLAPDHSIARIEARR